MRLEIRLSTYVVILDCSPGRADWDAVNLWFEIDDLTLQDRQVLIDLIKGTNCNWIGINDPSCPYSVDITINNRETLKYFRWETIDTLGDQPGRKTLRFTGSYNIGMDND